MGSNGVKRGHSIPYHYQQSPPHPPPHRGPHLTPFSKLNSMLPFSKLTSCRCYSFDDTFFKVGVPVFDVKRFSRAKSVPWPKETCGSKLAFYCNIFLSQYCVPKCLAWMRPNPVSLKSFLQFKTLIIIWAFLSIFEFYTFTGEISRNFWSWSLPFKH